MAIVVDSGMFFVNEMGHKTGRGAVAGVCVCVCV